MKKWSVLLPALCLLLCGCDRLPAAREMGDMALLRTMGVDRAEGGVAVTGSTGPRAKGLQGEREGSLVLSAENSSLSGACLAMQGLSDSYVFYGYVDQLLLGEELAVEGIRPVLDYFARDVELGLGAQLWLIRRASARQAVSSGGEEGTDARLSTLQTDGEMGMANLPRTAGEIYTDLLERGSAFAPALSPAGEEDTSLVERGYGVLKDFRLVGWMEGEAARGLELLANSPSPDMLTNRLGENQVSARITAAHTRPSLRFRGEEPAGLAVTCRVSVELAEYQARLDAREQDQLRALLERQLQSRLEAALTQLRAWGTDCAGLGARAGLAHPGKWGKIQEEWPQWFSRLEPEITVEVAIRE